MTTTSSTVQFLLNWFAQLVMKILRIVTTVSSDFVVRNPDVAVVIASVLGLILSYYILKNIVRIVVSLVKTLLKLLLIVLVVLLGLWVYFRGFQLAVDDFTRLFHFVRHFNQQEVEQIESYVGDWEKKARFALRFFST